MLTGYSFHEYDNLKTRKGEKQMEKETETLVVKILEIWFNYFKIQLTLNINTPINSNFYFTEEF